MMDTEYRAACSLFSLPTAFDAGLTVHPQSPSVPPQGHLVTHPTPISAIVLGVH